MKNNFKGLLVEYLGTHPWLNGLTSEWPISLTTDSSSEQKRMYWKLVSCNKNKDNLWNIVLIDNNKKNLSLNLEYSWFDDTETIEMTGIILNIGREISDYITAINVLDFEWIIRNIGQPRLRTITGGPWIDVDFPPYGLTVQDHWLITHKQFWLPIHIHSEGGRPTSKYLPIMVLCDEKKHFGFYAAIEWLGNWSMKLLPAICKSGERSVPEESWRLIGGLENIRVRLRRKQEMKLPRVIIGFFKGDLEIGCNQFRKHIYKHVTPKLNSTPVLPLISYNHWIAYDINKFDYYKAKKEANLCAKIGIEYFCFDAGWYKDGFRAGNGNWDIPDKKKFPEGIEALSRHVNDLGMKYGMWIEPEFAMKKSLLYQQHPDWFIERESKNEEVMMNFGLPDVQNWWLEWVKKAYDCWKVRWIRWDMNSFPKLYWDTNDSSTEKGITEIKHVLGVYDCLDEILKACPELIIEGCAGGGTRLEPGIIRRCHTYWINDQSSNPNFCRHYQHGVNTVYPANYANVNIAMDKYPFSDLDYFSHMAGSWGLSTKLVDWPVSSLKTLKRKIEEFKSFREELMGDFHAITPQPRTDESWHVIGFSTGQAGLIFAYRLNSTQNKIKFRFANNLSPISVTIRSKMKAKFIRYRLDGRYGKS